MGSDPQWKVNRYGRYKLARRWRKPNNPPLVIVVETGKCHQRILAMIIKSWWPKNWQLSVTQLSLGKVKSKYWYIHKYDINALDPYFKTCWLST